MKGGCEVYPNKGVKIDPRSITSAKMPESLKVYCGYYYNGYAYIVNEGIITWLDLEKEKPKIESLPPFCKTKNKLLSSHLFRSKTHLIEFFRTSQYSYKIYALRIAFFEDYHPSFRR
jgi:hypothetical protein